jgi:hypothetical protein
MKCEPATRHDMHMKLWTNFVHAWRRSITVNRDVVWNYGKLSTMSDMTEWSNHIILLDDDQNFILCKHLRPSVRIDSPTCTSSHLNFSLVNMRNMWAGSMHWRHSSAGHKYPCTAVEICYVYLYFPLKFRVVLLSFTKIWKDLWFSNRNS